MVWVRLDDHFDEHPKIQQVGPLGIALFTAGLAYCNRNLTDGFIPWAAANKLVSWEYLDPPDKTGKQKIVTVSITSGMSGDDVTSEYVISLLTHARLWDEIPGGFLIHDYDNYQPLKSEVLIQREHSNERQKRFKSKRYNTVNNSVNNGVNNGQLTLAPIPVPGPVPNTPTEEKLKPKTLGPAVDKTTAWPAALDDIRKFLLEISAPDQFFCQAYWLRIDQWLGDDKSGVAYFQELRAYLAHQASKNGNARGKHKDMLAGFRNWLATSKRWKDRDAERREIQRRQQPQFPKL